MDSLKTPNRLGFGVFTIIQAFKLSGRHAGLAFEDLIEKFEI